LIKPLAKVWVVHLFHLDKVPCTAVEEANKEALPNQEDTPQLEKE